MHANVRTAASTSRSKKTLAAEVADVGANLDASVRGSTEMEGDVHDTAQYRAMTPPAVHGTEGHLAEKWGLPRGETSATEGERVTRSKRITQRPNSATAKAAEGSRQQGVDAESSVDAEVIVARGELDDGQLPAVDQNALRTYTAARVRPYEIEEYFLAYPRPEFGADSDSSEEHNQDSDLHPVSDWGSGWTQVGKQRGGKNAAQVQVPQHTLSVRRKYFPDDFSQDEDSSDEPEDEYNSEPDSPGYTNFTVPKLPDWTPLDFNVFESIKYEFSDNEEITELLTEESDSEDDAELQRALLESWRHSKAQGLDAGWRASDSKVRVGVMLVELDENGDEIPGTRTYTRPRESAAPKGKGKGVDSQEKGPRWSQPFKSYSDDGNHGY
ncbi:hypothetical protein B0H13DRAFT_2445244 [Mycena leptocephala]|nr:hypothetical protein B0H13DRAFT_2445244 [Mycena leptocephala]